MVLFFLTLIQPIIELIINLLLLFNPNDYFVTIYILLLTIVSILFNPANIDGQMLVNFHNWLCELFNNLNFLFFLFFVFFNVLWFFFWFCFFYFHWINTKCKCCGYNVSFDRFNKTKMKDR